MAGTGEDNLAAALDELRPKAQAHRLADYMPSIDAKINAGVTHETILAALQANGFPDLKLATFRKALYRWRQKQTRAAGVPPSPAPRETSQVVGKLPAQSVGAEQSADDTDSEKVVESGSEIDLLSTALSREERGKVADTYTKVRPSRPTRPQPKKSAGDTENG